MNCVRSGLHIENKRERTCFSFPFKNEKMNVFFLLKKLGFSADDFDVFSENFWESGINLIFFEYELKSFVEKLNLEYEVFLDKDTIENVSIVSIYEPWFEKFLERVLELQIRKEE